MTEFSHAYSLVVLRTREAKNVESTLVPQKRIAYYHEDAFKIHYVPLCMDNHNVEPVPIMGESWSAILIRPLSSSLGFFDFDTFSCDAPLYIPALVLRMMAVNKRTLQLASYTCESTIAVMLFILAQRAHWSV